MRSPDVTPVRWMLYEVMDNIAEKMLRRSSGGRGYYVKDICEVHSTMSVGQRHSPLNSIWEVETTGENYILVNTTTGKSVPFQEIHSIEVRRGSM